MPKITPFLWFNDNAEQAMKFYTSIFQRSKILMEFRQGKKLASAKFSLDGSEFMVLNGGPRFQFTPAISLMVHCKTQAEVDHFWKKLSKGGEELPCGWLRDKFGLSWQIIPDALGELLGDDDPAKSDHVFQAMMQMKKIDIAGLKRAYRQT